MLTDGWKVYECTEEVEEEEERKGFIEVKTWRCPGRGKEEESRAKRKDGEEEDGRAVARWR